MTFLRKANTSFAMCTCLSLRGDHLYFARNMDLDCDFARTAVRAPRAFPLAGRRRHYAVAGVAQVREGIPYFAEGLNERGLYVAGLYFPDAVYAAKGMAPHVFMTSALALCASASEAARLLTNTDISGEGVDGPAPPLHWMLADRTRTLVVERRAEGLFVHENAFGVLTNSPPFPFHADNMRQYMGLSASPPALSAPRFCARTRKARLFSTCSAFCARSPFLRDLREPSGERSARSIPPSRTQMTAFSIMRPTLTRVPARCAFRGGKRATLSQSFPFRRRNRRSLQTKHKQPLYVSCFARSILFTRKSKNHTYCFFPLRESADRKGEAAAF